MEGSASVVVLRQRALWTLSQAIDLALEQHWEGRRKEAHARGWCRDLLEVFPDKLLATLTTQDLMTYRRLLEHRGTLEPATVKARLCVVNPIYDVAAKNGYDGPRPTVPLPYVPRLTKWWLKPDLEREVCAWLHSTGRSLDRELAMFVAWTVETGLRVEESLRVTRHDFIGLTTDEPQLFIRGTKTRGAEATMPITLVAATLALSRFAATGSPKLFTATYEDLWAAWDRVRERFGLKDDRTATLKAIRRSYARMMASRGAPLPVIQQLMRHGYIGTTMEYLRLTGGSFTHGELRQWVK